jgi:hypothetical protein
MRRALALLLCSTPALLADGAVARSFIELRVETPQGALQSLVDPKYGFGVGCMCDLGGGPGYIRLRLDGDTFTGVNGNGPVEGLGAGVQVVYEFDEWMGLHPFVVGGPCFQHWSIGQDNQPQADPSASDLPTWNSNKVAFRAEAGIGVTRRTRLSLGVLTGPLGNGQTATSVFLAFAYQM